jgi:hypothetical protein
MSNEDYRGSSTTARRLAALGSVGVLLVVALLTAVLLTREDDPTVSAPSATSSSVGSTATTPKDTRTEVLESLRSILRIRDQAFRDRDPEILKEIYTSDCPCLEGDTNAIQELTTNDYHVVGGTTSIIVKKVDRVSNGLWLVIADFRSAPLRIEAKDGTLIREEPEGSDLFQFALSRPAGSSAWLLGRATAYQEGKG